MKSVEVLFFLFADVKHYSEIPDANIPEFLENVLEGLCSHLELSQSGDTAMEDFVSANTWGDAIFLVFRSGRAAGEAALEMKKWLIENPFQKSMMEAPVSLRIGIHAGPAFCWMDPFQGAISYIGSSVNRAARIEPITDEGQIFVSEEFAALSAVERVPSFWCEPQGYADLPKKGGRIKVYRLCESNHRSYV